jgi:hypothetical protein
VNAVAIETISAVHFKIKSADLMGITADIWCLAHADAIFVTTPKFYIHMFLDVPSKFVNAHIDHKILHIHTTAIGYLISSLILTPAT